jgi:hypothetical protein
MHGTPHSESRKSSARFVAEWRQLRIAHAPAPIQLLYDELAIKEKVELGGSKFSGELNCGDERLPLRHVVRCGTDRSRNRGVWLCRRVISAFA